MREQEKNWPEQQHSPAREKATRLSLRQTVNARIWTRLGKQSKGDFTSILDPELFSAQRPAPQPLPRPPPQRGRRSSHTCGVPGVDDAQHLGVTVLLGLPHGTPQLLHVQGPAVVLVQVIVDLHGAQLGQDGRVEGVLRDGDHHPRPRLASPRNQDLQDRLQRRQMASSRADRRGARSPSPASPQPPWPVSSATPGDGAASLPEPHCPHL